jgi:hypothetical protein
MRAYTPVLGHHHLGSALWSSDTGDLGMINAID